MQKDKFKVFRRIFLISGLVLILSLFFDVLISYSVFSKNENLFLNAESNEHLVGELKQGISFFRTITITSMGVIYVFSILIILLGIERLRLENLISKKASIKRKKTAFFMIKTLYILCSFVYFFKACLHISGGLSWLD